MLRMYCILYTHFLLLKTILKPRQTTIAISRIPASNVCMTVTQVFIIKIITRGVPSGGVPSEVKIIAYFSKAGIYIYILYSIYCTWPHRSVSKSDQLMSTIDGSLYQANSLEEIRITCGIKMVVIRIIKFLFIPTSEPELLLHSVCRFSVTIMWVKLDKPLYDHCHNNLIQTQSKKPLLFFL